MGNRAGQNKFAKVGMAVGSLLAVTTCLVAMMGSNDASLITEDNVMTDQDFTTGLRNLGSVNSTMKEVQPSKGMLTPHVKLQKAPPIEYSATQTMID
jgi:hypothetical protein